MKTTTKKRAKHRLKIIQGQINGLLKAIDEDRYCIDVIHQSLAVQESLKSLDILLLENHLNTCVKDAIGKKAKSKKAIDELLKVYKMSRKK